MSDSGASIGSDLLRLTFCPQCDYSLEGLPSEGVCPECGRAYDQSMVIIRCRHGNSFARPLVSTSVSLAVLTALVLLAYGIPRARHEPMFLFFMGFFVLMMTIDGFEKWSSPRKGEWLLWIAADGMGVQQDFDPQGLMPRLRKWIAGIFWVAYFIAMSMRPGVVPWWVPLVFIVPMGIAALLLARRGRPKLAMKPDASRPGLIAWTEFDKMSLARRVRNGRCRLIAEHSAWGRRDRTVDVAFTATHEYFQQLRQRLVEWTGRKASDKSTKLVKE